jgi:hypothetical protein
MGAPGLLGGAVSFALDSSSSAIVLFNQQISKKRQMLSDFFQSIYCRG